MTREQIYQQALQRICERRDQARALPDFDRGALAAWEGASDLAKAALDGEPPAELEALKAEVVRLGAWLQAARTQHAYLRQALERIADKSVQGSTGTAAECAAIAREALK
jgi:hypothetical protein